MSACRSSIRQCPGAADCAVADWWNILNSKKTILPGALTPIRSENTLRYRFPLEQLRQAMLRQVWQDTDDFSTTDGRLGLLPEFYAEEIGMVFRKNLL